MPSRAKPPAHPPRPPRKPYSPILSNIFQELGVGAAFFDLKYWHRINAVTDVLVFEQQHGLEHHRHKHNVRLIQSARETLEPVLGTHAGFSDWFVPIVVRNQCRGVLAVGPFARDRPTSAGVVEHWRSLTGRQAHPADPEFSYYLSITLGTLVFDGSEFESFRRLLQCLAGLMSFDGRDEDWITEAAKFRRELEEVRFVERTWEAVSSMVDPRMSRIWASPHRAEDAARLGLPKPADQALVGLLVSKQPDGDPIEALLQSDRFQRACVAAARKAGDAVSGKISDYGVVFLAAGTGTEKRKRSRLLELGGEAQKLAKRFGFELHLGASTLAPLSPLSEHYQVALRGAEMALSRGLSLGTGTPDAEHPHSTLSDLRHQLAARVDVSPKTLPARFERYVEAAARHCGFRLEPLRIHLEVAFDQILRGSEPGGDLDRKTIVDLQDTLERTANQARTVSELSAAYRGAVADLSDAITRPAVAHHDRNLRRAVAYIHEHYTEELSLPEVARVGGFAPTYFSALFKQRERMTFARYVQRLRVERAHQLLATTDIGVQRVAQLSGFATANYMARVFRKEVGASPQVMRERLR